MRGLCAVFAAVTQDFKLAWAVQLPLEWDGAPVYVGAAMGSIDGASTSRASVGAPNGDVDTGVSFGQLNTDLSVDSIASHAAGDRNRLREDFEISKPCCRTREEAMRTCASGSHRFLCSKEDLREVNPRGCYPAWLTTGVGWWNLRGDLGNRYADECGCNGWNPAAPTYLNGVEKLRAWCCKGRPTRRKCYNGLRFETHYIGNERLLDERNAITRADSAQTCSEICNSLTDCTCFSFNVNSAESLYNCFLLASCEGQSTQDRGFISGPKNCILRTPGASENLNHRLPCYYKEKGNCLTSPDLPCKCGDDLAPLCSKGQSCNQTIRRCYNESSEETNMASDRRTEDTAEKAEGNRLGNNANQFSPDQIRSTDTSPDVQRSDVPILERERGRGVGDEVGSRRSAADGRDNVPKLERESGRGVGDGIDQFGSQRSASGEGGDVPIVERKPERGRGVGDEIGSRRSAANGRGNVPILERESGHGVGNGIDQYGLQRSDSGKEGDVPIAQPERSSGVGNKVDQLGSRRSVSDERTLPQSSREIGDGDGNRAVRRAEGNPSSTTEGQLDSRGSASAKRTLPETAVPKRPDRGRGVGAEIDWLASRRKASEERTPQINREVGDGTTNDRLASHRSASSEATLPEAQFSNPPKKIEPVGDSRVGGRNDRLASPRRTSEKMGALVVTPNLAEAAQLAAAPTPSDREVGDARKLGTAEGSPSRTTKSHLASPTSPSLERIPPETELGKQLVGKPVESSGEVDDTVEKRDDSLTARTLADNPSGTRPIASTAAENAASGQKLAGSRLTGVNPGAKEKTHGGDQIAEQMDEEDLHELDLTTPDDDTDDDEDEDVDMPPPQQIPMAHLTPAPGNEQPATPKPQAQSVVPESTANTRSTGQLPYPSSMYNSMYPMWYPVPPYAEGLEEEEEDDDDDDDDSIEINKEFHAELD